MAKQLAALVIEDVPGDVQIQIDRQEFVEKKLIFCAADDQIEVPNADADDGDAPDVTIFDKDDSVVYLDYPGYENYGKERKREISDSMRSRKKVMEDEGIFVTDDEPRAFGRRHLKTAEPDGNLTSLRNPRLYHIERRVKTRARSS